MSVLPPPKIDGGPWIMGILNVTPDSFSDGGRFADAAQASDEALLMLEDGADLIDVGGESTRPGAAPVTDAEEIARVVPVIKAIRMQSDAPISIDTMKPHVARMAFAAGANIWNDVSALAAPGALEAASALKASVILMHMQGEPRTMQQNPHYEDVVREVSDFLAARAKAAAAAGLKDIFVDPGIGFGKTLAHNLALVAHLDDVKKRTKRPLVFGASRKSLIAKIDETAKDASDRIGGSLALALAAVSKGADMVRVHDVRETAQALLIARALEAPA
ncbi:MAG: dihydropteroate synthase [Hyphomonadaceae bacterium]